VITDASQLKVVEGEPCVAGYVSGLAVPMVFDNLVEACTGLDAVADLGLAE
jgi:hypothetical protein